MVITDDFIFLELGKTGTIHIGRILKSELNGTRNGIKDTHAQINLELLKQNKTILGSIRDPWEWYVSLWAFGCDRDGADYYSVTKFERNSWFKKLLLKISRNHYYTEVNARLEQWKKTYRNVDDAGAFREWLYMVHDENYWGDLAKNYSPLSLIRFSGMMTYNYVELFCLTDDQKLEDFSISNFDELRDFEKRRCLVDYFIRNENLEDDLFKIFDRLQIDISDSQKEKILKKPKMNQSSRRHGVDYYYDNKSENLVFEREKLIVQKFDYTMPSFRN